MNYLVFSTAAEAEQRSREEAISRGCSGNTLYWWDWAEGADGRAVLLLGADIADGSISALPSDWIEQAESV